MVKYSPSPLIHKIIHQPSFTAKVRCRLGKNRLITQTDEWSSL